jgi:hypothetical protein
MLVAKVKYGEGLGNSARTGAIAQLGERLPCTQEVRSSILLGSTNSIVFRCLSTARDRYKQLSDC